MTQHNRARTPAPSAPRRPVPSKTRPRAVGASWRGLEPLEARLYMSFDPTAHEQAMIEDINRMRTNPSAELAILLADDDVQNALDFFHVDRDALQQQWSALTPVPPLAWDESLINAARAHSQKMIDHNDQQHQFGDEASIGDRITDAGYNWSTVGENIFAYATSVLYGHAGFAIDWGDNPPTNIQSPPGHRNSIMSSSFREIGIGILNGPGNGNGQNVGPLVITEDFGNRFDFADPWLLGVVFNDTSGDGFYTEGEGAAGVSVDITNASNPAQTFHTTTVGAGAYQLQVPPGTYNVQFSGGPIASPATRSVTVSSNTNAKRDLDLSDTPRIDFDSATYSVAETGPTASITLTRTGDSSGAVSVRLTTADGTAAAGSDYTATSQVLSFDAGQTTKTFDVIPILDDGAVEPDETLSLTLSEPGGGALLGARTSATLTITDNDDVSGPRVQNVDFIVASGRIKGFVVDFTDESLLDTASAQALGSYSARTAGRDKLIGTLDDAAVRLKSAAYDPINGRVTVRFKAPRALGAFFNITLPSPGGVMDIRGNALDGEFSGAFTSGNGTPGGNFSAIYGFGKKFKYIDSDGDKVSLKLAHGGFMRYLLDSDRSGLRLDLLATVSQISTLSGTVKKRAASPDSDGITTIAQISGLGTVVDSLPNDQFIVASST